MTFRALDSDGDFVWGQGRSSYLTKGDAVNLNIRTRLYCWLNDCFYRMDFGIDWKNLLGSRNPVAETGIIVQTRLMVAQSYGLVRINSVNTSLDRATRRLTVQFNIDTFFSKKLSLPVTF
jgi:hypothetical protein